ncbi:MULTISPECIES: hypothetical protein [unclassified Saccharibacter]|uniref:hypothetical protein n=1 Tax=unclassified Saccharibacter TaxID=2648722 RepID=UPI0013280FA9|nr:MULTISPECIES: hypothetical protein [unclassified Saccharibacter]MXV35692.1 hypothetical protein [Saccharibacter sp. EH611]MXV35780.1 hypothetical protein [Saccharibacter sp. EH611]MXV58306.1 hypothetical protein [Saccharibacter sp. EH70]MXV58932.1 hypothetical protein [Saccharibacter sp. EH70]MXV65905.1 hypothetical protein [Saccharibacter sp. EH60]
MFLYIIFLAGSLFSINVVGSYFLHRVKLYGNALKEFNDALDVILKDDRVPYLEKQRLARLSIVACSKEKAKSYIDFAASVLAGEVTPSEGNRYYDDHPDLVRRCLDLYMAALSVAGFTIGDVYKAQHIRKGLMSSGKLSETKEDCLFARFSVRLPRLLKFVPKEFPQYA